MQIRTRISRKERLVLERIAFLEDRSVGEVIRDAVGRYLQVCHLVGGGLTDSELAAVKFNTVVRRLRLLQAELDQAVFKIPHAKRSELAEVANTLDQLLSYIDEEASCPGPVGRNR